MHGVVIELVQNPKLQVSWCHRRESRVTRNECIDEAALLCLNIFLYKATLSGLTTKGQWAGFFSISNDGTFWDVLFLFTVAEGEAFMR